MPLHTDVKYGLLSGKPYTIGRKDCDIIVTGDASISRKHAQLVLSHPEANLHRPDRLPTVTLSDLSKFGTWVSQEKMEKDQGRLLNDGDELLLGTKTKFTIVYEPLIVTTSCLDNPAKKSVRSLMCTLGGHIINDWKRDCTLLVMNAISVTVKVICALVSLKHIVTPAYLQAYVDHLQGKGEKPEPEKFQPDVIETQIDPTKVVFTPDNKRKNVLQGMKFIFLNPKQFKRMSMAVELAGGVPVLMEEDSGGDYSVLIGEGSVVMQSDPQDSTQGFSQRGVEWIRYVAKYLKKNKKRMIPDPELGFAVLYCDTQKYCNPDVDAGFSQALPKVEPPTLSQGDILATDTEHVAGSPVIRGRNEPDAINETRIENKTGRSKRQLATVTKVKEEPLSQTSKETAPSTPNRGGKSKRGREEEVVDTPTYKKPKKEKITPAKQVNEQLRRSPRRSPSPARIREQSKETEVQKEPEIQKKCHSKSKAGKIIVEDSDEEFSFKPRSRSKEVESGKGMSTKSSPRKKKDSPEKNTKASNKVKAAVIIEDSSDEDFSKSKTSKSKETSPSKNKSDEDSGFLHVVKRTSPKPSPRGKGRKRNYISEDSDDDMVWKKDKAKRETKDSGSASDEPARKRRGVETENEKDDDLFSVETKRQTDRMVGVTERGSEGGGFGGEDGGRTEGDGIEGERNPKRSRRGVTATEQRDRISVKREQNEESSLAWSMEDAGFINTANPDSAAVKTESVNSKEEDQPSNCFVVKFVDLVTRAPKPREDYSEETPDGYTRWKGKLVKNFKKFKKSSHAGAGALPRIIGGSDLEPHVACRSKEIEEWFRVAEEELSQRSEREREVDDLFDCDLPKAGSSKRKGR